MKKLIVITAIVLGLSMTTFAQGGLFHRGASAPDSERVDYSFTKDGVAAGDPTPMLPIHNPDTPGDQPAPLGSGLVILAGLGGAYLIGKKRK